MRSWMRDKILGEWTLPWNRREQSREPESSRVRAGRMIFGRYAP